MPFKYYSSKVLDYLAPTSANSILVTKTISCQYPIMEIHDESVNRTDNDDKIPFNVTQPIPTRAQLADRTFQNRTEYRAFMWLLANQPFTWEVRFGSGSHVILNWTETTAGEHCLVTGANPAGTIDHAPAPAVETDATIPCKFPYRYGPNRVLYYGCKELSAAESICATEVDTEYVTTKIGVCNDFCHGQSEKAFVVE